MRISRLSTDFGLCLIHERKQEMKNNSERN